ncbi:MAG: hypothetical protein EOO02_00600 [Chitinophagaceae bacterium]|nr:MAG: hypothetical protein EOO02_00600 [Chitinophagaceae bacterium]
MKFSIRLYITVILLFVAIVLPAQELFVFSEPASNMPSKSIGAKYSGKFLNHKEHHESMLQQRHSAEIMYSLHRKWMLHGGVSFSDMFTSNLRFESAKLYAKYRFLSNDQVHKHFRMAAFGQVSGSRNPLRYDELSLEGDQSGVQAGLIATQLWKRFALSGTVGGLVLLNDRMKVFPDNNTYSALKYSVSGGLLILPLKYKSYRQTNLNLYGEFLGQQSLDQNRYFVDFAPAVQLIFNSAHKLNLGYRFQLDGNASRMATRSFHISFESLFLN